MANDLFCGALVFLEISKILEIQIHFFGCFLSWGECYNSPRSIKTNYFKKGEAT